MKLGTVLFFFCTGELGKNRTIPIFYIGVPAIKRMHSSIDFEGRAEYSGMSKEGQR